MAAEPDTKEVSKVLTVLLTVLLKGLGPRRDPGGVVGPDHGDRLPEPALHRATTSRGWQDDNAQGPGGHVC